MLGQELSSNPDDHLSIIRKVADHSTLHGGWSEWSVGCLCGHLYRTTGTRYYIPSRRSAERIYENHLQAAGVLKNDAGPNPDKPDLVLLRGLHDA